MKGSEKVLASGLVIAAVVYVAVGIFTFGHSARHYSDVTGGAIAGAVAAMAWPLYWSWEAQR